MGTTDSRTNCTCDDTASSRCDARLPESIRLRVPEGWESLILIPVILFVCGRSRSA